MTASDIWTVQAGGLYIATVPFGRGNESMVAEPEHVLRQVIAKVAATHGAGIDPLNFQNNLRAAEKEDLRVEFLLAKWEVCSKAPVCVGASLGWNTVGLDDNGKARKASYTEDLCLLNGPLRQLVRQKPYDKEFPEESLSSCFERLMLRNLSDKHGITYRYGEVDPRNTSIMRPLHDNAAIIGNGHDSAVLELSRFPSHLLDHMSHDVSVIKLRRDGIVDANNFVVSWEERQSTLRIIATRAQGTAAGSPRIDLRTWHNGVLPDRPILDDVIASCLLAVKREAAERKWGEEQRPIEDAHIHILNDEPLIDGFKSLGAQPRRFGMRQMMPGINVLRLAA